MELSTRVKGMLSAAGISFLALTAGCTNNDGGSPEPQGGGRDSEAADDPIDSAYDEALESIRCTARQNPLEDCDRDGVSNAADVRPGVDDLADDDGDSIANRRDKYPGLDDRRFAIDQDGLADYLDTFFGNNFADADGDGWIISLDLQPYAAPPLGMSAPVPPPNLTTESLTDSLLDYQWGTSTPSNYTLRVTETMTAYPTI